jgi:DNA modification methylase
MKLSALKTNPNNPRLIKDDKFFKLVNSILEFPKMMELRPMVYDEENIIQGGNMRSKALLNIKSEGKEKALKHLESVEKPENITFFESLFSKGEIPDNWTKKARDLTEEEKRRFVIADNIGFGEWDNDILTNEWDRVELEAWGLDLPDFEATEVLEAEEDDFDVPEGGIETDIVLGDLLEIGEHRLLCGDSTDSDSVAKLMNGEKADMVFTDPPYGMAYESNAWDSKKNEVKQKRTDTQILNDENTNVGQDALNLIPLFLNNDRHFYIWCRWDCFNDFKEVCQNIGKIKSVVVWDKGGPGLGDLKGSYGDSEWAIFGMIGRRELKERQNGVWQVNRMKGLQMVHPTQKPLELCERGINNSTNKNEIVLDLFLGSGSTMVAAHQLKRKCYGMELDPKYCQVIIDRMRKLDTTLIIKKNGEVMQ